MKTNSHRQRGTSMAEMAIVMVALLSLMFGIIDFGRALYTYTWLTDVAQKAVRWGMVRGTGCTLLDHCNTGTASDMTYIPNWVVSQDVGIVDPTKVTVSCDYQSAGAPGSQFQCTVRYPFTFMLPFMPSSGIAFTTYARANFTN